MRKFFFFSLLVVLVLAAGRSWPEHVDEGAGGLYARRDALNTYRQVASIVKENAAEPVKENDLLDASLEGMLHHLDPHSNYYTPSAFKDLMEDVEGKFSGLGMLVAKPTPSSPLLVVSPIPDTPASRAGLRSGDLIMEVDGEPTGKMTTREAVRKLKGPAGTDVTIKVSRGGGSAQELTLTRAPIPKYSVPFSFMLNSDVGYVKINTFGNTTVRELKRHLKSLIRNGAKSVVIDLRDNPGGSLPAAVGVASLFLHEGQEVVSVRGRELGMNRVYAADSDGSYTKIPLAVLINRGSASASEIVSGCLQDHDRAIIVGERSWGKGLVQTLSPLQRGAVAITTGRYYTPSGRLIQRDYSHSYDAYFFPDEQPKAEIAKEKKEERPPYVQVAHTDNGRPVYGGGGIAPDVKVAPYKIPELGLKLEQKRAFLNFMAKQVEKEGLTAKKVESPAFADTFKAYLKAREIAVTSKGWDQSAEYIHKALLREYFTMTKGQGAGFQAMLPLDLQVQKAEALMDQQLAEKKAS